MLQAGEETKRPRSSRTKRSGGLKRKRDVDFHRFRNAECRVVEMEPRREHTHYEGRLAIEPNRPSDSARVGAQFRTPEGVGEEDHGSSPRLILLLEKRPAM